MHDFQEADPAFPEFAVRGSLTDNGAELSRLLPMKIVLIALALVIVAATAFADYKWRRWMESRRRDRQ